MKSVTSLMIENAPVLETSYDTIEGMAVDYNSKKYSGDKLRTIIEENYEYINNKRYDRGMCLNVISVLMKYNMVMNVDQVVALILCSLAQSEKEVLIPYAKNLIENPENDPIIIDYNFRWYKDTNEFTFKDEANDLIATKHEAKEGGPVIDIHYYRYVKIQKILKFLEEHEVIVKNSIIIKKPTDLKRKMDKENITKVMNVLIELRRDRPKLNYDQKLEIPDYIVDNLCLKHKLNLDFDKDEKDERDERDERDKLTNKLKRIKLNDNVDNIIINKIVSKRLFRAIQRTLYRCKPDFNENINLHLYEFDRRGLDSNIMDSGDPLIIGLNFLRIQRNSQKKLVGFGYPGEFIGKGDGKKYCQNTPYILSKIELKMIEMIQNKKRKSDLKLLDKIELPGMENQDAEQQEKEEKKEELIYLFEQLDKTCFYLAEYVDKYGGGDFENLVVYFKRKLYIERENFYKRKISQEKLKELEEFEKEQEEQKNQRIKVNRGDRGDRHLDINSEYYKAIIEKEEERKNKFRDLRRRKEEEDKIEKELIERTKRQIKFTAKDGGRGPTPFYNNLVTLARRIERLINDLQDEEFKIGKLRKFLAIDIMKYGWDCSFDDDAFANGFIPGWYYYLKDRGYENKFKCLEINHPKPEEVKNEKDEKNEKNEKDEENQKNANEKELVEEDFEGWALF
ncbi:uncharacterized protein ASCRUDRAFT_95556 [Ascoidea rubescens DSM 1968]|uniref:Uncharacterized protein n=1 Tax=Ascoidea rubescens DSM 1968 TaxID=1344418 RepID=A0A1D2VPB4_9ASCO|nr:hypothetical protein ASCRUDRAFT_95556 [Ascoidea rubescens DSM 1968]ODV63451.1 hypothetical protein ASCRUDRAFT_95556 [Ascoidea rubescens DSM 1968]